VTAFFAAALATAFCFSVCLSGCSTAVAPKSVASPPSQEITDTKDWKSGGPRVPASKLALYRTGLIDPRARSIQGDVRQIAPGETEKFLRQLTLQHLKGIEDHFARIKVIHDWICASIDYDVGMLKNNFAYDQDVEHVLASKKAVCSGYSRLFQAMAKYAGFPCVVVSGYAKNIGGSRAIDKESSHAWNLVMIHGAWYIVDTTFDAGYIQKNQYVRRYSTDFLFIDPNASIQTHFPKRPEFQLLASPIDAAGYLALPDIDGSFFSYGLRLADPGLRWSTATSGDFSIAFERDSTGTDSGGIMLDVSVVGPDGVEAPSAAMIQRLQGGTQKALIRLPKKAAYQINVFAKSAKETTKSFRKVMTFRLDNSRPSLNPRFPKFYACYQESPIDSLIEPLAGILHIGETAHFRYASPLSTYAILIAGTETLPMKKGPDGIFEADVPVADTKNIKLATSIDGKEYWISVEWSVER